MASSLISQGEYRCGLQDISYPGKVATCEPPSLIRDKVTLCEDSPKTFPCVGFSRAARPLGRVCGLRAAWFRVIRLCTLPVRLCLAERVHTAATGEDSCCQRRKCGGALFSGAVAGLCDCGACFDRRGAYIRPRLTAFVAVRALSWRARPSGQAKWWNGRSTTCGSLSASSASTPTAPTPSSTWTMTPTLRVMWRRPSCGRCRPAAHARLPLPPRMRQNPAVDLRRLYVGMAAMLVWCSSCRGCGYACGASVGMPRRAATVVVLGIASWSWSWSARRGVISYLTFAGGAAAVVCSQGGVNPLFSARARGSGATPPEPPAPVPGLGRGQPRVGSTGRTTTSAGRSQRQPPPTPPPPSAMRATSRPMYDKKEQLRIYNQQEKLRRGRRVYLVNKAWFDSWSSWVGLGYTRAHPPPRPGRINNAPLLVRVCGPSPL